MGISQPRISGAPQRDGVKLSKSGGKVQAVPDNLPSGLPLEFDRPLVIVGGGAVDTTLLQRLHAEGAAVIAADGGADDCARAGIVPDAVIGDMDSVSDLESWSARTRVFSLSEQMTTDFEKCLYASIAPVTLALGMTGRRLDHTLAGLHAVMRHAADRRIILVDEHDLALGVAGSLALTVGAGARVSVYPLGRTEFASSQGLDYPLDGLVMQQGRMIGTSNRAVADRVTMTVADGPQDPWLLVLDRRLLGTVIAAD